MHEFDALGFLGGGVVMIALLVIQILYLWSLYKTMTATPERYHKFPAWFVWMIIIPLVGFVFAWIMVPFGLPNSLEAAAEGNEDMSNASKTLFGLGLAQMILFTLSIIPIVNIFTGIAGFIIWIIYWVKVVSFKNTYLANPSVIQHNTSTHE